MIQKLCSVYDFKSLKTRGREGGKENKNKAFTHESETAVSECCVYFFTSPCRGLSLKKWYYKHWNQMLRQTPAPNARAGNFAESLRLTRINYTCVCAIFLIHISVRVHRKGYVLNGKSEAVLKAHQEGVSFCKWFLEWYQTSEQTTWLLTHPSWIWVLQLAMNIQPWNR